MNTPLISHVHDDRLISKAEKYDKYIQCGVLIDYVLKNFNMAYRLHGLKSLQH